MKQRWIEHRDDMLAICKMGGSTLGRRRESPSEETRKAISETLKGKGCHPPWELSPTAHLGYKRLEVFGEESEVKRLLALREYNATHEVSKETRRKMSLAKCGERNINWKGGVTSARQQEYNNLETKAWRRAVFERDAYTCQDCGATGSYLNAHHLKEIAQYPDLRFDIDNGQTLCLDCHKLTDNYGGKWIR